MVFLYKGDRQKTIEIVEYVKKYISSNFAKASVYELYKDGFDYEHYFSPDVSTAYCFPKDERTYQIVIGMLQDFKDKLLTEKDKIKANEALLFHELGHTLFTTDDNDRLNEFLQKNKIPRSFWNLAEDARIEHLIREHFFRKFRKIYRFEFSKFLDTGEIVPSSTPEHLLFAYVNTENTERFVHPLDDEVYDFYRKFIHAKDSFEVAKICVDWKKRFHPYDDMEMANNLQQLIALLNDLNSEDGSNSLSQMRFGDIAENQEEIQGAIDQAINIEDIPEIEMNLEIATSPSSLLTDIPGGGKIVEKESTVEDIFDEKKAVPAMIDFNEVKRIENFLKEIKAESRKKRNSNSPSNKLNTKRLARVATDPNSGKLYKREKGTKLDVLKNKKIKIFLDISGSMEGKPEQFQKTLLVALNRLAKATKGLHITVTASRSLHKSEFQTIALPINEKMLIGYECNGSEGLKANVDFVKKNNPNVFKKTDLVMFITDGYWYDGKISRKDIKKDMKSNALLLGVYCGNEKFSDSNKNVFDKVIEGKDIVETVKEMVKAINNPSKILVGSKISETSENNLKEESAISGMRNRM